MDFLKWYKNKIESGNIEPPEKLWDDIQNDLDIDIVFGRLEKSLQKDRRKVWLWRASAAAGLLLLFSVGAIMIFNPFLNESPIVQKNQRDQEADSIRVNQPEFRKFHQPLVKIEKQEATEKKMLFVNTNKLVDAQIITNADTLNIITRHGSQQKDSEVKKILPLTAPILNNPSESFAATDFVLPKQELISVPENLTRNDFIAFEAPDQATYKNQETGPFSRLTIAVLGEYANTWLLNNKTIEGLQPENFTATEPTFSNNYGFSVATNLTERWELVSQISLGRQYGQNYHEYIHGKYVSNNINLQYLDISLAGRYRPFRQHQAHALTAGVYNGFLQKASQSIDGENISVTSEYSDSDYGVIAGYEYRTPISEHFTLGAGLFYRMGLKNIFAGNELVSSNLNHSVNTSFNFSLSIGYTFSL